MLVALPTQYGPVCTHAVRPGAESAVAEAVERYDSDADSRAPSVAGVVAVVVMLIGVAAVLTFLPRGSGFIVLGLMVFSLMTFPAFFFWMQSSARRRLYDATRGHAVEASALDHVYQSGEATDAQEWSAAHLAKEARELRSKAWNLRHDPHGFTPVRLTPAREAEAANMEARARKLDARVARLLDPPVRRRLRKRAVVG